MSQSPVTPRPASTVLLLRDGPGGLEVFMVVRHHQIDFATGALVFPGGSVDPTDMDGRLRARTRGADGLDDLAFGFRVAAIREAFEESGVLLARPKGSDGFVDAARTSALVEAWAEPIEKGETTLAAMLQGEDLELAVDALVPFAHWITPPALAKRFDTHFFLAPAPVGQLARHDGRESVDSVWVRPADACAAADAGERTVIFPTRMNLEKLGRSDSVAAALETAAASPVVTVEPRVEVFDGGRIMRIPIEAGYGAAEVVLEGKPGEAGSARRMGPDGVARSMPLAAKLTR